MMLNPRSDEERLEKFFAQLRGVFPYVTEREVEDALSRPCKYRKLLEERNKTNGGEKEAGPLRKHPREAGKDCGRQRREDA
jgi:hypothetical protein